MTAMTTTESTDDTWMDCIDNRGESGGDYTVNDDLNDEEAV